VLRGDAEARELLTAALMQKLVPRLRARYRSIPEEYVSDAVTDAIVQHLSDPSTFDPVRHGSVEGFIWMRARRHLSNALRSLRRDAIRDAEYARLRATAWRPGRSPYRSEQLPIIEESLNLEPDPGVRSALREWLAGDHGSAPWLEVAWLGALSAMDATREIRRQKDRFIARVKRMSAREPLRAKENLIKK
jgi:hypothetical protein